MIKYLIIISSYLLAACLPEKNEEIDVDNIKIIEGQIGQEKYYVPEPYLFPLTKQVGPESILLQIHYPSFAPLSETTEEMWKRGDLWQSYRILVNHIPNAKMPFDEFATRAISGKAATEIVGEEYGLIHKTQRDDPNNEYLWQLDDVWYEQDSGRTKSYIICSEKIHENSVEICQHYFRVNPKFFFKITFNKKLLQHWKTIQEQSVALFHSFESPKIAKDFLLSRVNQTNKFPREE